MKVLGLAGSLRAESHNRKALKLALRFASEAGAVVTEFDLKANPLPFYDDDLAAQGIPESVTRLKAAYQECDVMLIASPEYNYTIPGVLKNAIDWISRPRTSMPMKVAAIFGASGGPYGTIRMQPHLRTTLTALDVIILPQPQVFIANARNAFTANGELADQKLETQLRTLVTRSIQLSQALTTLH